MLHINIQSFLKNKDPLILLLNDLEERGSIVHAVGLCETFLNTQTEKTANMENYRAFHVVRNNKVGGGMSILIHNTVKTCNVINIRQNDSFEACALEVCYKWHLLCITKTYRPPNSDDKTFIEDFKLLLDKTKKYRLTFHCGDYNYDLLKSNLHKPSSEFFNIVIDDDCILYVTKPTRVTHRSSSLIDNIIVKSSVLRDNLSYIITDSMSDHYPCLLSYTIASNKISGDIVIEKRKITDDALLLIQQKLLFYDWLCLDNLGVNESYETLINIISAALDEYAPMKVV